MSIGMWFSEIICQTNILTLRKMKCINYRQITNKFTVATLTL